MRYPHTAGHAFRAATECRHPRSDDHDSRRDVRLRDAGTGSRSVSRPSPLGLWWTLSRPGHIWLLARVGAVDGTRTRNIQVQNLVPYQLGDHIDAVMFRTRSRNTSG
jgi:hypothetical protein